MKKSRLRLFIIPALMAFCTLFYYFGELVNWAAWNSLRFSFFYAIHDVHRLFFLVPICYAGYTARVRGALIVTLVSFVIFLPRAFFISPYPDAFLRMFIFVIFAGALGVLTGIARKQMDKARRLGASMASQRDRMLRVIDTMGDGIAIIGADYKIKLMNSKMTQQFGEGTGQPCYQHFYRLNVPCSGCKIKSVIENKEICSWQSSFPDGRESMVVAAPYSGDDGAACQMVVFRDIAPGRSLPGGPFAFHGS